MRLWAAHRLPTKGRKTWGTHSGILPFCSYPISQTPYFPNYIFLLSTDSSPQSVQACCPLLDSKRFSGSSSSAPRERKGRRWETLLIDSGCCGGPTPMPCAPFPGLKPLCLPSTYLTSGLHLRFPGRRNSMKA